MTRILIADDHQLVAEGIARLLDNSHDLHVEAIAGSINEAVELSARLQPDVVLLDVGLPDGDGIDAIPRLQKACPRLRIIIFTMYAEAAVVHRALATRANGFLLKTASAAELTQAISSVMEGETYLCNESQGLLDNCREAPPMLTQRERDILRLLVAGLSHKEIADRLCLGFETVHSYTKYIRQKMGCANTASLVRKAISQHLV